MKKILGIALLSIQIAQASPPLVGARALGRVARPLTIGLQQHVVPKRLLPAQVPALAVSERKGEGRRRFSSSSGASSGKTPREGYLAWMVMPPLATLAEVSSVPNPEGQGTRVRVESNGDGVSVAFLDVEERNHPLHESKKTLKDNLTLEGVWISGSLKLEGSPDRTYLASEVADNGLFGAAISAWVNHRRLELNPNHIWLAVVGVVAQYMNSHDSFRSQFVDHEGKQNLAINAEGLTTQQFVEKLAAALTASIKSPEFAKWMMPNFSTTTEEHRFIASGYLAASFQKSFSYAGIGITCGLPGVLLRGTLEDWQRLKAKISELKNFAAQEPELVAWVERLEPIAEEFIKTFKGEPNFQFWQSMIVDWDSNKLCGAPPTMAPSGWIMAFAPFDKSGKVLTPKYEDSATTLQIPSSTFNLPFSRVWIDGGSSVTARYILTGGLPRVVETPEGAVSPMTEWMLVGTPEITTAWLVEFAKEELERDLEDGRVSEKEIEELALTSIFFGKYFHIANADLKYFLGMISEYVRERRGFVHLEKLNREMSPEGFFDFAIRSDFYSRGKIRSALVVAKKDQALADFRALKEKYPDPSTLAQAIESLPDFTIEDMRFNPRQENTPGDRVD